MAVRSCDFGPVRVRFDSRVLAPRAWTLLQSRWAAELAEDAGRGPLVELCAGAGAIGLAAAALSGRRLVQVERDPVAAGYARGNAAAAGIGARVDVRQQPLESALRQGEVFPLMLADPPYLSSADVPRWPEDPVRAIDGGTDGLAVARDCLALAALHLSPGAPLLLQVAGAEQAAAVREHVAVAGLRLRPVELREVDPARAVLLLVADSPAAAR